MLMKSIEDKVKCNSGSDILYVVINGILVIIKYVR